MRLSGIGRLYAKINLIRLGFKYYRRATFPALGEGLALPFLRLKQFCFACSVFFRGVREVAPYGTIPHPLARELPLHKGAFRFADRTLFPFGRGAPPLQEILIYSKEFLAYSEIY